MCDPLLSKGGSLLDWAKKQFKKVVVFLKSCPNIYLFIVLTLSLFINIASAGSKDISLAKTWDSNARLRLVKSPLFEESQTLFNETSQRSLLLEKENSVQKLETKFEKNKLADNLMALVGDTPMREMVPYIASREHEVAAFLIGIAKKESSFGLASPLKDGNSCYNYWGYKGEGSRGNVLGYSCFASAQEAVEVVGNRLADLVAKDRNTPAKMVDTWKCGKSCAGDLGAPSWVSTVALYFDEIVQLKG